MKKNFRFYADIKHVVWERNWHTIPAETKEEALQWLINNIDSYEYHDESEILYDTLTPLDLENDPDGAATEEIRDEVDTLLWDNFKDAEWLVNTLDDYKDDESNISFQKHTEKNGEDN